MADKKHLGQAFKEARDVRDQSLDEVEQRAGLDSGTLEEIENGDREPDFDTMQQLAQAIGAPMSRVSTRAEEIQALSSPQERS